MPGPVLGAGHGGVKAVHGVPDFLVFKLYSDDSQPRMYLRIPWGEGVGKTSMPKPHSEQVHLNLQFFFFFKHLGDSNVQPEETMKSAVPVPSHPCSGKYRRTLEGCLSDLSGGGGRRVREALLEEMAGDPGQCDGELEKWQAVLLG